MSAERDALIEHYGQMRAELLDAIDGLRDELMTEPSLDGWSVKDHLAHLALWDDMRALDATRISAGFASAWRMSDAQSEALNALAYDLRRAWSLAQVRWELEASRERLLEALAQITSAGLDASRYGEAGLHSRHEALHTGWIRRWREQRGE